MVEITASKILTQAASIVAGARNATHGDKERSFIAIAALWNAYFDNKRTVAGCSGSANSGSTGPGSITARDVAQCMVLLKVARSIQGEPVQDHFLDAAGYAAIAGELADKESKSSPTILPLSPLSIHDTIAETNDQDDEDGADSACADCGGSGDDTDCRHHRPSPEVAAHTTSVLERLRRQQIAEWDAKDAAKDAKNATGVDGRNRDDGDSLNGFRMRCGCFAITDEERRTGVCAKHGQRAEGK